MKSCVVAVAVVCFVASGCAPEAPAPVAGNQASTRPGEIGVIEVTNEPLAWVVRRLAAPLVEVRFRASDAADPAYWSPTTADVLAMQQADLVVLNGASYEPWLATVSLPASRLVDTTAEVRDRLIPVAETVTHSHGLEGEHEHTGTAFTTWLDPTLLTAQARAVEGALAERWPEHGDLFAERSRALAADLAALDAELEAATAPLAGEHLIFSHPVYQYLAHRYRLTGSSVHFEPEVAPDDDQWRKLDHLLGHEPTAWMIWESDPTAETRRGLAERGCGVIVLAPCATPPAEGDFLAAMRRNVVALQSAAGPEDPSPAP
ncbi:MAG: metal ABC transporter substrate-binding protein [Thermoanaerobaculales bacterium]|jgi:zinc transport system substrate-binding protein|nr:metal ABC transporter substrate-binding protein [Thermoanaerobaculales bacterium]